MRQHSRRQFLLAGSALAASGLTRGSRASGFAGQACPSSLPAGAEPDVKSPIVGLVTMGRIGDVLKGLPPVNSLGEAKAHPSIYAGAVIMATWARLEPHRGHFDLTDIEQGLTAIRAYNRVHPDRPLAGKLRIYAGPSAPAWARSLAGGPIVVNKKGRDRVEIGKFWTVPYQQAWRELQHALADRLDREPLLREVAVSSCASLTAEPFILPKLSSGALQAAGYNDAAMRARLVEAIDDYSPWQWTALDYTFNPFWNLDSGIPALDPAFVQSVMRAFRHRYGPRAVIAYHGLNVPLRQGAQAVLEEMESLGPPIEFQTFSPTMNFKTVLEFGLKYHPTEIELWDSKAAKGLAAIGPEMLQTWAAALANRSRTSP